MLFMSAEEIKQVIDSHNKKVAECISHGLDHSELGRITANIYQRHYGKFNVIFDTPIGPISMRSARREYRDFASIDSAMNCIKSCGYHVANVVCRGD